MKVPPGPRTLVLGTSFVLLIALVAAGGWIWTIRNRPEVLDAPDLSLAGPVVEITVPPDRQALLVLSDDASFGSSPDQPVEGDPDSLYVSPTTGDDGNDGQTMASPWQDLQESLDRLEPGQTLYLMDGTYQGPMAEPPAMFVVRVDGTPDEWVHVAAAPGHEPLIAPTEGNGLVVKANYVEVRGLTVRGEGFGPDNPYGWGLVVRNSHHVRLVHNTVSDMPVGGISGVESSNLDIIGNVVHDNSFWGTEQGSGISLWHSRDWGQEAGPDGYHDRIIGNVAYRNENRVYSMWHPGEDRITDGNGIIIDESRDFGYTGRFLVANNLLFDNGGRGILVTKAHHVDVVFNTSYWNGRTTELHSAPTEIGVTYATDVRVLNNLAISRPGVLDFRVFEAIDVESAGNVMVTDSPSGSASPLDLVTVDDPGLVGPSTDPDIADFRPGEGSLIIGQGVDYGVWLDRDLEGQPRDPGRVDVGAFHFGSDG